MKDAKKDMKLPRIIIGSETEYAIYVDPDAEERMESAGYRSYKDMMEVFCIEAMLDECDARFTLFSGTRGAINTLEEHAQAEKLLAADPKRPGIRRSEQAVDEPLDQGMAQRRGKSGSRILNGARFYRDMGHPEYSTPEATNPRDVLVAQRAGDGIVEVCRATVEKRLRFPPGALLIHKNNSDGKGGSYGGHENYSIQPDIFEAMRKDKRRYYYAWPLKSASCIKNSLTHLVFLFFVTRQIVIGSGKIGSEYGEDVPYQISQRSDFFTELFSTETTCNRGIINMRDSPYANPKFLRRFHVILADSNMSELSIYLKHGMAGLFFMMLNDGFLEESLGSLPQLAYPVEALHVVSRDTALTQRLECLYGRNISALEAMRYFAECASRFVELRGLSAVWRDVVEKWEAVLDGLESGRHKHPLSRSLDWVVKERLLRSIMKQRNAEISDDVCWNSALAYHNIDPTKSVFHALESRGEILRLTSNEEVSAAYNTPPLDTRAWLRSELLKRYGEDITRVGWEEIQLWGSGFWGEIHLPNPFWGGINTAALFDGNPTLDEFIERIRSLDPADVFAFFWRGRDEQGGNNA